MSRASFAALALGTLAMCGTAGAQSQRLQRTDAPPRVVANDNRVAAGTLRGGVREIRLVARQARWFAAGDADSSVVVPAFAEEGGPPRIPGPLARVPRGTAVRFVVRNALADSLIFCLRGRVPCDSARRLALAPGDSGTLLEPAADTGAFVYWGAIPRLTPLGPRLVARNTMSGVLVVDGARPRPDRILALNATVIPRPGFENDSTKSRFFQAINGRMWPATERFAHAVGDTVRWRLVNLTLGAHPMHLHGFYFRVTARGDGRLDTTYTEQAQRLAVTELMEGFSTATIEWVPERAGNWIFHCHRAMHVAAGRLGDLRDAPRRDPAEPPPARPTLASAGGAVHAHHDDAMAGMIVAIAVKPRRGEREPDFDAERRPDARRVRLLVQERRGAFGHHSAFGFAEHAGGPEPAAESLEVPLRPLVVRRGEPVSITVVNRLAEVTGVHWHGIELQSFFDGVGGLSGAGKRVAPMIAPGDSFVAHFTPPRAGTFMFHAHADEMRQLGAGMVAPLIVLEPGVKWDPSTDHVLVLSQAGPADSAALLVNGRASHHPLELRAGVPHRFRVVAITPQVDVIVSLHSAGALWTWRPVAKDGADLPAWHAVEEPARRRFGPGETFDFVIVPRPGTMELAFAGQTGVLLTLRAR